MSRYKIIFILSLLVIGLGTFAYFQSNAPLNTPEQNFAKASPPPHLHSPQTPTPPIPSHAASPSLGAKATPPSPSPSHAPSSIAHTPNPQSIPSRPPTLSIPLGSAWHSTPPSGSLDPYVAFSEWVTRWNNASPDALPNLLAEGLPLAKTRREALRTLIISNPTAALAQAVPMTVRAGLPEEILALLEERVAGNGELSINYSCLHSDPSTHKPSDDFYRSALINGQEYRAYTYGNRLTDGSLASTSIIGIAVDHQLAVSDSRYRILEAGETLGDRLTDSNMISSTTPLNLDSSTLAVEANGIISLLPSPDTLSDFETLLIQQEPNHTLPATAADNQPGSSTVTGRPDSSWSHGSKKLLVIRVDFSDLQGTPINKYDSDAVITDDYVVNVINASNGVKDFFSQGSYGKSTIVIASTVAGDSPDVTGVLRMPSTASYYAVGNDAGAYNNTLHEDARNAAQAAGYNLTAYDRIAVVFSSLGSLANSKITYGGLAQVIGANFWVNGEFDLRVVAHELGHTYGLNHSNLWQVNDGDPVSATGNSTEYGDPFDIMGDGGTITGDFSPWNKSILQWIPDTGVTVATSAGTYRIYRFDAATANLANPRALKIVRDSIRDYWIGYRRSTANTALDNGASVQWGYNTNSKGNLLDLNTPNTDPQDSPLALAQTFNDSVAGITLTTLAQGGSGDEEYLDIQIAYQPRIQWSKTSYLVNEQSGSAILTLTRSANSTGAVSVNYTTGNGTATSPADFTAQSGTITWSNGDSADKTITIPVTADGLVEGTEDFTVTLSGMSGGVIVDAAAATVSLADPGARDSTFTANWINSRVNRVFPQPDGKILVAGWFSQVQDAAYNIYDYARIARLTSTGAVDTTFNPGTGANGTNIYALARQPDGKILIGGDFTAINGTARNQLARLNADGSLDTTFNPGTGSNDIIYDFLLQPDGKIIIGGAFTTYNGTAREYLARLHADGSLDTSFVGPDFGATSGWQVETLALQKNGNLLVGGQFYFVSASNKAGLCSVTANGSLDATFNGVIQGAHLSGNSSSLRSIEKIAVLPDDNIIITGTFSAYNNTARAGIARLTSNGSLDTTFNPTPNNSVKGLLPLPDGSILIGGDFTTVTGGNATRIARLMSNGTLDTAFAAAGGHAGTVMDFALLPDGNVLLAGDFASFQGSATTRPLWRLVPGLSSLPSTFQFTTDSLIANEGSSANLTISRTGGSMGAMTLGYSTIVGTATTSDYTTSNGVLTWANGDAASKTISIPITLDGVAESPETFTVNLGAPLIGSTLLGARQQNTVTINSAFVNWQAQNFTSPEIADSAISGATADPDSDGINNLLEFALGLSPKSNNPSGLPTVTTVNISGTDYLTISYRRRIPAEAALTYTPQATGDLTTLWSATPVLSSGPTANGDGTETVTYRDTIGLSAGNNRFLRLQINHSP